MYFTKFKSGSHGSMQRGFRIGRRLWLDRTVQPWHSEWRWLQIHVITWDRSRGPAFGRKIQFEIKTYKTTGMHTGSVVGSKRYVRFAVCL